MRRAEAEAAGEILIPPGMSKESPLPTCGTTGSYIAVADAACADGSRPLDGDIQRAIHSRQGNVGPNLDQHIIDRYMLTCPEGRMELYVDMYGCDDAKPSRSDPSSRSIISSRRCSPPAGSPSSSIAASPRPRAAPSAASP